MGVNSIHRKVCFSIPDKSMCHVLPLRDKIIQSTGLALEFNSRCCEHLWIQFRLDTRLLHSSHVLFFALLTRIHSSKNGVSLCVCK